MLKMILGVCPSPTVSVGLDMSRLCKLLGAPREVLSEAGLANGLL
jgi:hypothetical protein